MRSRTPVILLVCLVAGLPGAGHAFHEPTLPVIESAVSATPGWVSFKFESGVPRKVAADVQASGTGPIMIGAYWYKADDTGASGFTGLQDGFDSGARLDVDAGDGVEVHAGSLESVTMSNFLRAGTTTTRTGTWKLIVFGGGEITDWRYSISSDAPGVTATESGDAVFLHTSKDFSGTAHLQVGGGVRAEVETERTMSIGGTLIGSFSTRPQLVPGAVDRLSVVLPDGTERACGCSFTAFAGDARAGPGPYRFRLTGAGYSSASDVTLMGVDARLPA